MGEMKHIGKKLIRYGDIEFIGDEYLIELPEDLSKKILDYGSDEILENILNTQIKHENYESAEIIRKEIERRKTQ